MTTVTIIRLVLVIIGIVLLISTIFSLAKRIMTETLCLVWGILALMFMMAGILLKPIKWTTYVSTSGSIIALIALLCLIWCLFFITMKLSVVRRKNQELAMQISLLNQENERIRERLDALEKNTVCN